MQKIIILGKPNVGKSSLFNCFLKQKVAITSEVEGTTRDINMKQIQINGIDAIICDTAGIVKENNGIFKDIKEKILSFISKEDIVIYVTDSSLGIQDDDISLFHRLKNAILVVNKTDLKKNDDWEYSAFGSKEIFFISTAHNRGLKGLKDYIGFLLVKNNNDDELLQSLEQKNKEIINIGIIGRVNVGKSSLLNALLDKERSLVSEIEGTTIDPVSDDIEYKDKILHFVDTAGIRRRSKIEGIEKYALDRTKKILESSNIVLLVLDCSRPFVELDEKISGLSDKYNLGIIIILNKWDIRYEEFSFIKKEILRKFAYLTHAPILTISAVNKRHINSIKDMILKVWENFNTRIPTSILNEHIKIATQRHPLPSDKGKIIKIYYATQIDSAPPKIILIMNKPKSLHFSYKRYLINYLRKNFNFSGVPILIFPKAKHKDNEINIKDNL
ncbi:ribosome biogenesis GTPase Der [Helicobacter sp. MIT 14-3879]|uniref:ribosome biogenesis GTPase Der n=1 Tax=Helicobacter sp. MIT 14-3879 TaxID=2040649 RepID=UPI000E1E6DBE|nr:ribosome biogenesis GTPase Der [Helicobacter sp. MIT 14-3879]RDU64097.1 ribosome biogenesis GTPase Der [Helicobacter sp. MIT 14-3879]